MLIAPGAPAAGGEGGKAAHLHIFPGTLHREQAQGHVPAQHGVDRALELPIPGGEELLLPVPQEADADLRMGEGLPLYRGKDCGCLLYTSFNHT